jgi:phosphatidyl-myo-inositol dimannoside synthase
MTQAQLCPSRASARTAAVSAAPDGRPRLLILTPDFPPDHGGVQVFVHRLARAITGFRVEIVTLARPEAPSFDSGAGLATRRVGAHLADGQARMLALNAEGIRHALRFRPNVTLSAHLITSPAARAIRGLLAAHTVQYFHANEILGKPRLAAFAATRADLAVAVSAHTASLIAATGATPANLRLIPPGVTLPSEARALPAERPTVLTVAQLRHRYKGHDVLIRALELLRESVPDVEWIVIGDGPLRAELEYVVSCRGLAASVRFLGAVCDAERDRWLRRANVLAMPSRAPGEGFGLVYLEANAHGKPVLAGNVAGALDAVIDGVTGLLVDPTDPVAVAGALRRLLLDPHLARRLGRRGAERAREFAWPAIAARLEAALADLGVRVA